MFVKITIFVLKRTGLNKTLDATKSNVFHGTIVKTCPSHHYQKEFHQALETFIEREQVL